MNEQTQIQKYEETTALAKAEAPSEIVRLGQLYPDLAQRAMAIIMSRPVDQYNTPLAPARAIAAALYEQQTGQICGQDFYADNRMGIVPGYRGRVKEAADRNVIDYIDDYRPFTQTEANEHDIKAGDTAKVCELTIPARAKACREAGIPFKPVVGFGIVRAAEKLNRDGKPLQLSGGYTWERKARNRALKDALSHTGIASTAAQVIETAQVAGYDLGHDAETLARLNRDQAVYVVETAQRKEQQAYQQAETQAAELLAQVGASEQPEATLFDIEPTDRPPHWSDDDALVTRMYAYAAQRGMDEEEVLRTLGADELSDFTGTAKDAKAKIDEHAKLLHEMAAADAAGA